MDGETKKEKGRFVQKTIKINILIQVVGWPICLLYYLGYIVLREEFLWLVIHDSVQYTLFLLKNLGLFFRIYVGFHSLVTTFSRYCFVVV